MAHFDDAKELVAHAGEGFSKIRAAYDASLRDKEVKKTLLIEIKNIMENLRSALDFAAHGLFERYGSSSKTHPKIYFPYATAEQTLVDFQQANRIEQCIPGVSANRPDVPGKLESYQHFADNLNRWLPIFMDLNNENKHRRLTPQIRKETRELRISSGGTSINMGEGTSISMGPGASIRMGGLTIPGGQKFGVNRPPRTVGSGKTEVITWVSFHFASNNEPVLPLLEQALNGVGQIVNELSAI